MPRFFQTEDNRFCELVAVGFTENFLKQAARLAERSTGKNKDAVLAFCERVGAWPQTKVLNGLPRGVGSGSWQTRHLMQNPHAGRGLLLPLGPSASSSPEFEVPADFNLAWLQGEVQWIAKHRSALIRAAKAADFMFDLDSIAAGEKGWRNETNTSQRLTDERNVPDLVGGVVAKRVAQGKMHEPSALDAFGQATAFAVFTQGRGATQGKKAVSGYLERLRGSDKFDAPLARASLFESEAAARERIGRVVSQNSHAWTIVEVKIRATTLRARSDPDSDLGELAHAMSAAEAEELQGMLEKAKIEQLRERLKTLEERVSQKAGDAEPAGGEDGPSGVAAKRGKRL